MAKRPVRGPAQKGTVTIGQIIEHVKAIEDQCRILRLLLQQLDKTTEVKLTAQLKRTLGAQVPGFPSAIC
jgi:hypothetical protein